MFGIGSQELLILFLVVLLLFGADRIPEVARAVGKSIRDFKRAAGEIENEFQEVAKQQDLLTGKKPGASTRARPKKAGGESSETGAGAAGEPEKRGEPDRAGGGEGQVGGGGSADRPDEPGTREGS